MLRKLTAIALGASLMVGTATVVAAQDTCADLPEGTATERAAKVACYVDVYKKAVTAYTDDTTDATTDALAEASNNLDQARLDLNVETGRATPSAIRTRLAGIDASGTHTDPYLWGGCATHLVYNGDGATRDCR